MLDIIFSGLFVYNVSQGYLDKIEQREQEKKNQEKVCELVSKTQSELDKCLEEI